MKYILAFILSLALTAPAVAGDWRSVALFSKYSSADTNAAYSAVVNTTGMKHKSFVVNGYNMSTLAADSLSGTALIQCGPTSSGPWFTCVQEDSTAISLTANGGLQWSDMYPFVRASWAKTAGRASVWLYYGN